ncbi:MAG TPA: ATP-binding protein [Longimicrobiales bacterium]|nr:ATP-binding protein [Longimicrobiales bacterium]
MSGQVDPARRAADRGSLDLKARILSPHTALLVLIAACNLFLVHAVVVLLLVEPPYSVIDLVFLWGTAILGVGLLVYGGIVGWESLRHLRDTEERLTETRSRLQALVEAAPLAITAEAPDGTLFLWSGAAPRVLGWREDEVFGGPDPTIPEEGAAEWAAVRRDVLAGEVVTGLVVERVTRGGVTLEMSLSAAPVRDVRGEVRSMVALLSDVTQRRESERERQRLEEQLRQAQKMEAVGRLAGGVAHDFNNLLTAIKGHAELLLDGDIAPARMRDDLGEITRSTDRAAALTRQLLTFSRQSLVEPVPLDLNDLIRDMDRLLKRVLGETVELETVLHTELGRVLADPGQVEQVLMNLVVNARDAMPHGGRIVIRTANAAITGAEASRHPHPVVPGDYVVVTVTDTGMGMDPDIAARIFEPFFTTKPAGVGTGLGLSTTYGIVKQARGYVWVDTELGRGSTFMVYLPRVEA